MDHMEQMLNENPQVVADLYEQMKHHFEWEWLELSSHDRVAIVNDMLMANAEDGCTVAEYRQRIGTNNLAAYVRCLNTNPNSQE